MSAWFHAFVENSNDLDQSRLNRPIVEHMHRLPDLRLSSSGARMPQMEAAKSGGQFLSVLSERAFRICCNNSHGCGEENIVAAPAFGSPSFGAWRENIREIALGRLRQAKTRH